MLFSERGTSGNLKSQSYDDGENMVLDKRALSPDIDPEASSFVCSADFSYWLQDSVCHKVEEEVSY